MTKKFSYLLAVLIVLSMALGACAPAATPAPAVQEPVAVATEAPAEPTEVPAPVEEPTAVPEPAPDFAALFTEVIASIPADKGSGTVSAAKLNEELASGTAPFLVDVREQSEVEKDGYIEGAIHLPIRSLTQNLDKLPGLDQPIVIYCASGHRGGMGLAALKLLGYTNVRNLGGGLGAWKKAELPVVTGQLPPTAEAISTPIVENKALFEAVDAFIAGIPEGFYSVNAATLNEELASDKAPFIVDVRTTAEWDKDGYIEGAVNLPLPEFMANLDKLPAKDQPIIVMCASGHRGGIALAALKMLGYENVRNLGGGLGAWKAAQLPVAGVVDWNAVWKEYFNALPAGFYTIKAADLNSLMVESPVFLLDVREAAEVEKDGYIAGSVNIPVREVLKNLDKLPALDQPIVVYCASGHRGGMMMAALQILGYADVRNLAGGLGAWKAAELPVETGSLPAAPVAGTAPELDAALLSGMDGFFSALPDGFFTVKPADLNTELASGTAPVMIDLRTEEEIATGAIEGAQFISINTLLDDPALLPADKAAPIVVICQSGHRGGMALAALRMLGYSNVRNLGGGMNAWVKAELPVVK